MGDGHIPIPSVTFALFEHNNAFVNWLDRNNKAIRMLAASFFR
jgi:hypothetical protein